MSGNSYNRFDSLSYRTIFNADYNQGEQKQEVFSTQ